MPRTDPTTTARLWVNYNDGFFGHSLQFRYDAGFATEGDVMLIAHNYLTALDTSLYEVNITDVERAVQGSNVRNPVVWTGDVNYGTGAMPAVNSPKYIEFTGRDHLGKRWHLTQFGVNITIPDNWILEPADVTNVDNARTVLTDAFTATTIVSISFEPVIVNNLVPIGYNDHYIVQRRS